MNYIELLEKYMQGLTSQEEENALLHWMRNEDKARQTIYAYYEKRWNDAPKADIPAELQYKMLTNIKKNIQRNEKENNDHKSIDIGKKIVWKDMMKYAAIVLLTLTISIFSMYYFSFVNEEKKVFVVYADKGQRSNLILPDGTKVWLNSGSRLEYNSTYSKKERKVKLIGEAFFEVSKDKRHRFLVKTELMDIEALGTAFNVQAYPDENEVTTSLVNGKVRISTPCKDVILLPNQQVCYVKSTNSLSTNDLESAEYANAWIHGEFSFKKATLEEIAKELNRMYNMEFKFNSDEIKGLRFTGIIKNNSLTNVLEIISLTAPVTFEVKDDYIILDKRAY